jgi:hypothetical protein
MRKALLLVVGAVLLVGVVAAQDMKMPGPTVKQDITFTTDVRIGTTMVKAGDYRVVCDHVKIAFFDKTNGKKVLEVPCKGKELTTPSKVTEAYVVLDNGVHVLDKLYVKGSTVEHTFN